MLGGQTSALPQTWQETLFDELKASVYSVPWPEGLASLARRQKFTSAHHQCMLYNNYNAKHQLILLYIRLHCELETGDCYSWPAQLILAQTCNAHESTVSPVFQCWVIIYKNCNKIILRTIVDKYLATEMLEFNAVSQYCVIYIAWLMALLFMPRPEHSKPRPKTQSQGWTIPRPRNLALRPSLTSLTHNMECTNINLTIKTNKCLK